MPASNREETGERHRAATKRRELGPGVIAVVLSGAGTDGTDGVQAVKAGGGTVIVQDRATSERHDMPRSAIATGAVDYVLPVEEIGPLLTRLTQDVGNN